MFHIIAFVVVWDQLAVFMRSYYILDSNDRFSEPDSRYAPPKAWKLRPPSLHSRPNFLPKKMYSMHFPLIIY